jgi:hypothetical protein
MKSQRLAASELRKIRLRCGDDCGDGAEAQMRQSKNRRTDRQRLPLTITLDAATFRFVEDCARLKQFRSIDEFFDAALANYRKHVLAVDAYLELELAKGRTFEEVMASSQCEIVFTRQRAPAPRRTDKK